MMLGAEGRLSDRAVLTPIIGLPSDLWVAIPRNRLPEIVYRNLIIAKRYFDLTQRIVCPKTRSVTEGGTNAMLEARSNGLHLN